MKLKRVYSTDVPRAHVTAHGVYYRCHYETHDGRFRAYPINGMGTSWQCRTTDGSEPFRGYRGKPSSIFNADSLQEIRDELDSIYDESED